MSTELTGYRQREHEANPEFHNLPDYHKVVEQIVEQGYAMVEIGPETEVKPELERMYEATERFITEAAASGITDERVFRYRTADDEPLTMSGLRLMNLSDEYSTTPDRPDLCHTLSFMPADADKIPNWEDFVTHQATQSMMPFYGRMYDFAQGVVDALAEQYGGTPIDIGPHSFFDAKFYPANRSQDEFRQAAHDDGQILTIALADQPGLELLTYDESKIINVLKPSTNRVVVMPGDLLTYLTGGFDADGQPVSGAITPQKHQVRNYPNLPRHFAGLFVNPDVTSWTEPWVETQFNSGFNISAHANNSQREFGMAYYEPVERVPNAPNVL